jgi:hypothetical protein
MQASSSESAASSTAGAAREVFRASLARKLMDLTCESEFARQFNIGLGVLMSNEKLGRASLRASAGATASNPDFLSPSRQDRKEILEE